MTLARESLARDLLDVLGDVLAAKLAHELGRHVLARRRAVEAVDALARLRPRLDTLAAAHDDDEALDLAALLAERHPPRSLPDPLDDLLLEGDPS